LQDDISANQFIRRKKAPQSNAYKTRFAKKFGLLYAVGTILVRYKLVDWSMGWVDTAISRCYENAWSISEKSDARKEDYTPEQALIRLMQARMDERFVPVRSRKRPPIVIEDDKWRILTL
jgi:hypothetical protein